MSSGRRPIGDDEAVERFEELYRTHYRKIVAYARRRTHSIEDADDVAATTFSVAWRRLEDLVGADEPLAWLYGVAYRTVLSHRRGVARAAQLVERAASQHSGMVESVESSIVTRDQLERAAAAVDTLSRSDQEILRLVGWEECSHAEIAQILDISRVLVRTRLLRARRRLQTAYARSLRDTLDEGGGS
ncbi:MAG: sigma-70 family RNA polymerase sigma factor [Acidimicrobiia bacterium]